MYWVQDRHTCQENYEFPDVITQQQFLNDVDESLQKHGTRKKAAETGKQIITYNFAVPLKNRTKRERWEQTLQDTLDSIIGTNGILVSHIIREVDSPNYARHGTW